MSSTPSTSTPTSATDAALSFGVLGPFEVRENGRLLIVSGRQERALLALLLTAPGRVFSVSAIVAGIWGEDAPARAEKTVQSYVSRLRRILPGDETSLVLTRSPGYVAAVDPERVDAERFRTLATAGRHDLAAGRTEIAAAKLREALSLWRGDAYEEFDAPFAVNARTTLEEIRLTATEERIAADLALGAGPELVAELEELVSRHSWRERFWAQLMTALYRSGRQGDALGAYQRARVALDLELGVEPGPELKAIHALVLDQDASLLAARTTSDALPVALTVVGPTFVGREVELARLLDAYDRATKGSLQRILLTGPHGMGKTRLLAELAREVQARAGLIRYGHTTMSPQRRGLPVVILLDDLQSASIVELTDLAEQVVGAHPPLLVVGSCVWEALSVEQVAALSRMFHYRMPLPPLEPPDIAKLVGLYVPPEAVGDGVDAVAQARGVPLQIHAAASRFGEELATTQVEEAVAGISAPRRHLSSSQERVADGVFDLQRIRLTRAAHAPAEPPRVVCPYRGLAYFDVDDAPYFFGRERLVAHLVAKLVGARLLAVVGASGSGKSSAIRAGLVAAIRAGMLPGSELWRIVLTTPTQATPDLLAGTRTLLVVDQFEEFFTSLSLTEQKEYADWLAATAADDDVTVVVAVRSDYYPQAVDHRPVADLFTANTVLVGEMTADELRQAVELPAAAAGLDLEAGLAEIIADDVAGEPGGLPLMSTALLSLWERRDGRRLSLAAYREIGGVHTAVARLAETAYAQLTPSQQLVARRTLLRLAETSEGGEPVRRRVPFAEVAAESDADARAVLDTLASRRLLTVSETHAEVAHEALLREWPRLRDWLDEDEAGRQLRRHLAPAATDWQTRGRDPAELYRGPRLVAALDWQRDNPDELTELEHDFLRTSKQTTEMETQRRRRSIRRLRVLAVGLAAVLALALIAGALFVDQRNDAEAAALHADVRALQGRSLNENRLDRALLYAAQAQQFEDSADSHGALLQAVQRTPEAKAILSAEQALVAVTASADGKKVVASGAEGTLYIWDAASRQRIEVPDTAVLVGSLDISADGRYVALVGLPDSFVEEIRSGTPNRFVFQVVVVDLEQTSPIARVLEADPIVPLSSARFAADGRTIVTLGMDGRVRYLDVRTGVVQRMLDIEIDGSDAMLVDGPANRQFMVAANRDGPGPVVAWDVDSGRKVWSTDEPDGAVASISPDGSALVVGHADGRIEHIDVRTKVRTPITSSLEDGLVDLTWSPDGTTFAGATEEQTVHVWDSGTLQLEAVLRGHSGEVTHAAFSPDGKTIYASGNDLSVLAWNWDPSGTTHGIVTDFRWRPGPGVKHLALAPDGSVAAARYSDGRVAVLDVANGQTFEVVITGEEDELYIDRIGGRHVLVIIRTDPIPGPPALATVHVIDVQRQALLPHSFALVGQTASDATVTWDGQSLLTAAQDRIDLWDLETGEKLSEGLYEAPAAVSILAVHPNGQWAALGMDSGTIEVIDIANGELVKTLKSDRDEQFDVFPVFSPDGRWLAGTYFGGRVVVWDTRSWKKYREWEAVEDFGGPVFASDSRSLVAGGVGIATIRSVEQGAGGDAVLEIDPLRLEDVQVGTHDNGRTVVTFTESTGVRQWSIEPQRLLDHACTVAGRNLTQDEWKNVLPNRPYQRTCEQYPEARP